jgi:hypothetical protein
VLAGPSDGTDDAPVLFVKFESESESFQDGIPLTGDLASGFGLEDGAYVNAFVPCSERHDVMFLFTLDVPSSWGESADSEYPPHEFFADASEATAVDFALWDEWVVSFIPDPAEY